MTNGNLNMATALIQIPNLVITSDNDNKVYAMLVGIADAEGLNPSTVEEAKA